MKTNLKNTEFQVILLVNHVYFSVGNKGVLHEKVSEKKGYLTKKIFSKFQNFKNYITIPVPTKIDGPVLYKPYLNVNAQRPDTGAIAPNPLWAGYSYGAPTTTRRTKTKLDDLHEWKTKKVHKIREIKKIIKEEPTDDEAAAASLAQRKEIAMLKKFHMHGIVDMYRPKQNSGSLAHGIGWGWSESAYAPVRKKKPKQKKKKLIKKKKKKKQAPSAGGWGEKGALAPAPKPHLPKRKKVKQKKMKNKGIGWGNDGGWSPSSVGATGGKISNHEPGSFPNFPIVNSIPPAASGRTTSNGLYGYIPKETSGYKVTNKKKKSKKRQKQKKTKKKFSNKDLLKRVLQDSASYEADSHRSKNSIEIANEHNLRQHHQRLPNKSHLNGIQEGEEHTVDEIMEPGSELYFRRMPLVFEEHYDYGDDRSIYSKFKK